MIGRHRQRIAGLALVPALLGLPASGAWSGDLFLPTPSPLKDSTADASVLRRRIVDIDYEVLGGENPSTSELSRNLSLNLFGDARFSATLTRRARNRSGSVFL